MSEFVPPMKALAATHPPSGVDWAAELKWDGMRLQVAVRDEQISLRTGSGRPATSNFPELHALGHAIDADHHGDVVFDGECVVFDEGRPSFHRLQHRIHVSQPSAALVTEHPVFFVAFDLLQLQGHDLASIRFEDRRRLLEQVLDDGPNWRVPPISIDGADELFALAKDRGLEGIVCKRLDSLYRPGERSHDWVKVKVRLRQEFVVGGWLPGSGGLAGSLGSLIVGVHDADDPSDQLVWAGAVGSGLGDDMRRRLMSELAPTDASPFTIGSHPSLPTDKTPTWVEPTTVVEVEFSLWEEGGQLWHPTFRGVRTDRDPADVTRETFASAEGME